MANREAFHSYIYVFAYIYQMSIPKGALHYKLDISFLHRYRGYIRELNLMVSVLADVLVGDGARPSAGTAEFNICTEQLSNTSLWASYKILTRLFGIGCNNVKVSNYKTMYVRNQLAIDPFVLQYNNSAPQTLSAMFTPPPPPNLLCLTLVSVPVSVCSLSRDY